MDHDLPHINGIEIILKTPRIDPAKPGLVKIWEKSPAHGGEIRDGQARLCMAHDVPDDQLDIDHQH